MPYLKKITDVLNKKGEVYLRIKALPGSDKSEFLGIMADDTIKIAVKARAEKGQANIELIKFLAKETGVSRDSVKIISGAGARMKLIKIKI